MGFFDFSYTKLYTWTQRLWKNVLLNKSGVQLKKTTLNSVSWKYSIVFILIFFQFLYFGLLSCHRDIYLLIILQISSCQRNCTLLKNGAFNWEATNKVMIVGCLNYKNCLMINTRRGLLDIWWLQRKEKMYSWWWIVAMPPC